MTLLALPLFLAWSATPEAPCIPAPVRGDAIEARLLSTLLPEFGSLPPDTNIFPSPVPGALRVVHPDELRRTAQLHGIVSNASHALCFAVPMQSLTEEHIQQAMQREIGKPHLELEILDYSRQPLPEGDIVFPRAGLAPPPNHDLHAPLSWRGYIQYTKTRRFPILARVRVSVRSRRLVVVSEVRCGEAIHLSQVRQDEVRSFPFDSGAIEKASEVEGMIARKTLPPGTVLTRPWLTPPILIQKGEEVTVETRVGAARLILKAVAETAGRLDGSILVRNPSSGRFFQGKIVGPGKVEVATSGYAYLMHNETRGMKK